MGDNLPTTNPILTGVDALLHGLIYDVAVNAAIVAATSSMPWLGLPIVSSIFRFLVNQFAGLIYPGLERLVSFQIIAAQTNAEQSAYQKAVDALKQAQASGDANALDKAKSDFKKTLGNLIHTNGS